MGSSLFCRCQQRQRCGVANCTWLPAPWTLAHAQGPDLQRNCRLSTPKLYGRGGCSRSAAFVLAGSPQFELPNSALSVSDILNVHSMPWSPKVLRRALLHYLCSRRMDVLRHARRACSSNMHCQIGRPACACYAPSALQALRKIRNLKFGPPQQWQPPPPLPAPTQG